MTNYTVVAISGKQGSGKSTLARNLIKKIQQENMFDVSGFRFAKTIYDIHDNVKSIMESYGIPRPEKDGKLLQLLGTEWGRKTIDENVWVTCTDNFIKNWASAIKETPENQKHKIAIIEDTRFRNEFDLIPAFTVRLECDRDIRKSRCPAWREDEHHISETDLDQYVIDGKFNIVVDSGLLTQTEVIYEVYKNLSNFIEKPQTISGVNAL